MIQEPPTCSADHVLPLHHVCVALVELANALARQPAVVELQDVPHLHRQCADLVSAPLLGLHQAVAPPHIKAVQSAADGHLVAAQHQGGVTGVRLVGGGLLLREWGGQTLLAIVYRSSRTSFHNTVTVLLLPSDC